MLCLENLSYGDFEINELVQMPDLFLNLALDEEETQKSGIAFILDMDGMSWGLLRYLSTQAVKVAAAKAEVSWPFLLLSFSHLANSYLIYVPTTHC